MSALDKVLAAARQDELPLSHGDEGALLRLPMLLAAADAGLSEACELFMSHSDELGRLSPDLLRAVALVFAGSNALDGLTPAVPQDDWVAMTALDVHAIRLAGGDETKAPYGDVEYADPGYQSDGKKRYPVDNPDHVRAAWSYINKGSNSSAYNSVQLSAIKSKIKSAAKKHGIEISDDSGSKVAATVGKMQASDLILELANAALTEETRIANHTPFHGAHAHPHMHLNDNRHGPGMMRLAAANMNNQMMTAYQHERMAGVHNHAHVHANDATHGPMSHQPQGADEGW